ncbi:hypothetical protein MRX96_040804 [Rhipicephalus microplus]
MRTATAEGKQLRRLPCHLAYAHRRKQQLVSWVSNRDYARCAATSGSTGTAQSLCDLVTDFRKRGGLLRIG